MKFSNEVQEITVAGTSVNLRSLLPDRRSSLLGTRLRGQNHLEMVELRTLRLALSQNHQIGFPKKRSSCHPNREHL